MNELPSVAFAASLMDSIAHICFVDQRVWPEDLLN